MNRTPLIALLPAALLLTGVPALRAGTDSCTTVRAELSAAPSAPQSEPVALPTPESRFDAPSVPQSEPAGLPVPQSAAQPMPEPAALTTPESAAPRTLESEPAAVPDALCAKLRTGRSRPVGVAAEERVVVAYVTAWSEAMPDPQWITHINYAFGQVNETFDGLRVEHPERLRAIVALCRAASGPSVLLSVGGWGSGGFSRMAADPALRQRFTEDCLRVVEAYGLAGIDIDWEYPTSSAAGIDASPADTRNFTRLVRELRRALGPDRLLTVASPGSARFIRWRAVVRELDWVNVMAYDMGTAPRYHAALGRGALTGEMSVQQTVEAHRRAGVPANRIVVGIPFYGRGAKPLPGGLPFRRLAELDSLRFRWDMQASVPTRIDARGKVVFNYDDPLSIALKCSYLRQTGLRGAMYWEWSGDDDRHSLARAVWEGVRPARKKIW